VTQEKGKKVEKKEGPTTRGRANLAALSASVANKFGGLEVLGIEDTYSDQTLAERRIITKDALSFGKIMQRCMNMGFELFFDACKKELEEVDRMGAWREAQGFTETKDVESEDPAHMGDYSGAFSSIQMDPDEPTSPAKKSGKLDFQQGCSKRGRERGSPELRGKKKAKMDDEEEDKDAMGEDDTEFTV
jgi:hypothetical protein